MKLLLTALLFMMLSSDGFAQMLNAGALHFDHFPPEHFLLDKGWKFQAGDNPEWARTDFNDSGWRQVSLSDVDSYLPAFQKYHIGWFRIKIYIDSPGTVNQAAIMLSQLGASDCYLNGVPFLHLGLIGTNHVFKSDNPHGKPFLFHTNQIDSVTLAIRFASAGPDRVWLLRKTGVLPLSVSIGDWHSALNRYETHLQQQRIPLGLSFLTIGVGILFLLIYIFSPDEKVNLLFVAFCFFLGIMASVQHQLSDGNLDMNTQSIAYFFWQFIDRVCNVLVLAIAALIVFSRLTIYEWVVICYYLGFCSLFQYFFPPGKAMNALIFAGRLLVVAEFIRIGIYAVLRRRFVVVFLCLATAGLHATFVWLFLTGVDGTGYYLRFNEMMCFATLSIYLVSRFALSVKGRVFVPFRK